ncbi:MAG: helix-turn-helix domain-containing protein [Candidatus Daviesbacteria bacterium]
MRTVGQTFKEEREAKFYTLEQVEKATKIRKELLEALEADDYSKLPPSTFVQGFIKNYAKFLKLNPEKMLALFRREFPEGRSRPYIMDAFANPVTEKKFKITPGRILGMVVALIVLTFFAYLWIQFHQFVGPPKLALTSPSDQLTTDIALVFVEGSTDPEVKISVNGQEIAVGANGEFKEEVTLSSPVNKITVVASSKFGQKSQLERTVYLKR